MNTGAAQISCWLPTEGSIPYKKTLLMVWNEVKSLQTQVISDQSEVSRKNSN